MIAAWCLAALLAGQGADILTTTRLSPVYREGNPLLPHQLGAIIAVKVTATTTLALAGWRIRKQHPKLAIGLFLAGAVSGSVGAWHNAHLRSHP